MCAAARLFRGRAPTEEMDGQMLGVLNMNSSHYLEWLSGDLRKNAVNRNPLPRQQFFMPDIAPLTARGAEQYRAMTVPEPTQPPFDAKNLMCNADLRMGRYPSSACLFRGRKSTKEADEQMMSVLTKNYNDLQASACDMTVRGA